MRWNFEPQELLSNNLLVHALQMHKHRQHLRHFLGFEFIWGIEDILKNFL